MIYASCEVILRCDLLARQVENPDITSERTARIIGTAVTGKRGIIRYSTVRGRPDGEIWHYCRIYSPWDIVSGYLDYYDPPGSTDPRRVENRIDPHATTLLKAHLEYWRNPLLFQILHRELTS